MSKKKLRPCDCVDMQMASTLTEQGIGVNDQSILVEPGVVVLKMGHTTVRIPMKRFQLFAEWFLEPQDTKPEPCSNEKHDGEIKWIGVCSDCKSKMQK